MRLPLVMQAFRFPGDSFELRVCSENEKKRKEDKMLRRAAVIVLLALLALAGTARADSVCGSCDEALAVENGHPLDSSEPIQPLGGSCSGGPNSCWGYKGRCGPDKTWCYMRCCWH